MLLYYLPRALAGLIVAFLYVFVVEGLTSGFGFWDSFWHFVLASVVLLFAVLAWKKPRIGGFVFTALGLLYLGLTYSRGALWPVGLILGGIVLITGVLFLAEGFGKKSSGKHVVGKGC